MINDRKLVLLIENREEFYYFLNKLDLLPSHLNLSGCSDEECV